MCLWSGTEMEVTSVYDFMEIPVIWGRPCRNDFMALFLCGPGHGDIRKMTPWCTTSERVNHGVNGIMCTMVSFN